MSEQGADQAGKAISDGFKFFLKAVGLGAFFALVFWQAPNITEAMLKVITTLKG
ncbi:hypothetical protein [Muribacter muris]|uniref:hypothetical protein n=1 Tax=Muribacter muris TaxID=67855 RepID=UPI000AEEF8B8|nr:hypothetical protein [Muribacter muris]